jgi:hypothetical protein
MSGPLDGPDNLAMAPNGDPGVRTEQQNLSSGSRRGACYHLARNTYNRSELRGLPADGHTLL